MYCAEAPWEAFTMLFFHLAFNTCTKGKRKHNIIISFTGKAAQTQK